MKSFYAIHWHGVNEIRFSRIDYTLHVFAAFVARRVYPPCVHRDKRSPQDDSRHWSQVQDTAAAADEGEAPATRIDTASSSSAMSDTPSVAGDAAENSSSSPIISPTVVATAPEPESESELRPTAMASRSPVSSSKVLKSSERRRMVKSNSNRHVSEASSAGTLSRPSAVAAASTVAVQRTGPRTRASARGRVYGVDSDDRGGGGAGDRDGGGVDVDVGGSGSNSAGVCGRGRGRRRGRGRGRGRGGRRDEEGWSVWRVDSGRAGERYTGSISAGELMPFGAGPVAGHTDHPARPDPSPAGSVSSVLRVGARAFVFVFYV